MSDVDRLEEAVAQTRQELAHIKEIAYDTASIVVRYASGDRRIGAK